MNKEYMQALEEIRDFRYGEDKLLVCQTEMYSTIKQALQRLESIDNANPSEALEYILNKVFGYGVQSTLDCLVLRGYNTKRMLEQECLGKTLEHDLDEAKTKITDLKGINTIKQALIKAQENEKENARYKKVFELIKEKGVDISIIMSTKTVEEYNGFIQYCNSSLSEAEYNLLKEMFS